MKLPSADSESQQIVNEDANTSEVTEESLPLDAIEAIYPKLGTYRNESLSIWETFSEEKKRKPSASFKLTSVKHLMPLTRCI